MYFTDYLWISYAGILVGILIIFIELVKIWR